MSVGVAEFKGGRLPMAETKYAATVLQKYADDLYSQARWVVFSTAFVYAFVSFVGVFLLEASLALVRHLDASLSMAGAISAAAIAAGIGVSIGRKKAFMLKLEAQKILCQCQIELNTRSNAKPERLAATAGN
jgi:hypothetical protein